VAQERDHILEQVGPEPEARAEQARGLLERAVRAAPEPPQQALVVQELLAQGQAQHLELALLRYDPR